MRLAAFMAAIGIIIAITFWLVVHGYPHFVVRTKSALGGQVLTVASILFTSFGVIWAVRKLP